MLLMGVMEAPAYSLTAPITHRLGRRSVAATGLITSGVAILLVFILHESGLNNGILYQL